MFEEDFRIATMLAKKTQISGSVKKANRRVIDQEKERAYVIKAWNNGDSMEDIAHKIRASVHYVNKYMDRFKFFYGDEAVKKRHIPFAMPEV